jgi:hypothetical protein
MPAQHGAHTLSQSTKENMLSLPSFLLLPLVWLQLVLNIWTWAPQWFRTASVVYTNAEWDFKCCSAAASWIGPPSASMDVCEGQFDLETMSSCPDQELGTREAYPLELVAYANAVPSPDDLSIFHVSISYIPALSHHMVAGDQISYEDDQYSAIGVATGKHTSGNGRHTVVIRGSIHNKITGSIGYGPSITEDTPSTVQYWYVLLDSDYWQDKHGLRTSWSSKHWILQHAPVLNLTGYYELSRHQGGDIEQGWGQRK